MASSPAYQPFWCEENCWHLATDPLVGNGERLVLVITGRSGRVACWAQRAAAVGEPLIWDYHVVLAVQAEDGWRIWDLDSRLGFPLPASAWLAGTFPCPARVPVALQPRILAVPAEQYRRDLVSDRSHMRTPAGRWQQEPPSWPPILGGMIGLDEYLRRARGGMTYAELCACLGIVSR